MLKWGFMRTFPGKENATVNVKFESSFFQIVVVILISLLAINQSVSHRRFYQCVNPKKKLSMRHPLSNFGTFSYF